MRAKYCAQPRVPDGVATSGYKGRVHPERTRSLCLPFGEALASGLDAPAAVCCLCPLTGRGLSRGPGLVGFMGVAPQPYQIADRYPIALPDCDRPPDVRNVPKQPQTAALALVSSRSRKALFRGEIGLSIRHLRRVGISFVISQYWWEIFRG